MTFHYYPAAIHDSLLPYAEPIGGMYSNFHDAREAATKFGHRYIIREDIYDDGTREMSSCRLFNLDGDWLPTGGWDLHNGVLPIDLEALERIL